MYPNGTEQTYNLNRGKTILGRSISSMELISLESANVSKRHAEIELNDETGFCFVRDLGSFNGTELFKQDKQEGFALSRDSWYQVCRFINDSQIKILSYHNSSKPRNTCELISFPSRIGKKQTGNLVTLVLVTAW